MKIITLALLMVNAISTYAQKRPCKLVEFSFAKKDWAFRSNVEGRFKKHELQYKPPGYYYKIDENNVEVILGYHSEDWDFDDEYQPKEVLFPRILHSYIFQIPEKNETYDSLKNVLEKSFKKKFIFTKGLKEGDTLLESERPFEFNFLEINSCLTVGIKRSHAENRGEVVTVRFMYGLSLGYMGTIMGSY
ncbi:hypothetical protein [Dyadobacter arcticus]|uniref:Uncharacterized protein n=1 Tax=Dyadobacter arcticus TaxID=1078754 RepID=A0ABX0UF94_9BACT|nr:hypothetical protein [Dyadobacter arcticus]NIJ51661.1 hypothetical protein [Dyadobacter arcticus]